MIRYFRGEIYNVDLNPTRGSEMQKARPCIIVSNDIINANGSVVIICPITDSYGKFSPMHIRISGAEVKEAGLEKESVIHCGQVRAIDKERIGHKIGKLNNERINELSKGLRIVMDLDGVELPELPTIYRVRRSRK